MLTDERLLETWWKCADAASSANELRVSFARAVEREATAELRADNERLRGILEQLLNCDILPMWAYRAIDEVLAKKEDRVLPEDQPESNRVCYYLTCPACGEDFETTMEKK